MEEKQSLNVTVLNGKEQEGTVRIRKIREGTDNPDDKSSWITDATFTLYEFNVETQQFTERPDYRMQWNNADGYYHVEWNTKYNLHSDNWEENVNGWQSATLPWTQEGNIPSMDT